MKDMIRRATVCAVSALVTASVLVPIVHAADSAGYAEKVFLGDVEFDAGGMSTEYLHGDYIKTIDATSGRIVAQDCDADGMNCSDVTSTFSASGISDYLKSVNAAGAVVAVVGGTEEPPVSLRTLLDLDDKLNRAIPELPSSLPTGNLTVQPGGRVQREGRVYFNIASSAQTVSYNSLLSRVKQTDGDNRPFIDVTGTGLARVVANPSGSGGDDLNRISIGGTNYNIATGTDGTTVTANPADDPTATLMTVGIADNVFRVGRATYYNSGGSPSVAGIPRPRVPGEIAVNNLGHVYPAVDMVEGAGFTDASITSRPFSPSDYYELTSTIPLRGDFWYPGSTLFIQNQTDSPLDPPDFPSTTWNGVWTYIAANVNNVAEYRDYRDNWIFLGQHHSETGRRMLSPITPTRTTPPRRSPLRSPIAASTRS